MARRVVLDQAPVLEDLEYVDGQGRTWYASDHDSRVTLKLLRILRGASEPGADFVSFAEQLVDVIRQFFAARHTPEELDQLLIPGCHLFPLASEIVEWLNSVPVGREAKRRAAHHH